MRLRFKPIEVEAFVFDGTNAVELREWAIRHAVGGGEKVDVFENGGEFLVQVYEQSKYDWADLVAGDVIMAHPDDEFVVMSRDYATKNFEEI